MGLTRLFVAIKGPIWSGVLPRDLDVTPATAPPGWVVFTKDSADERLETVERVLGRRMSEAEDSFWCAWVEDSDYAYIFGGKGGIDWRFVYGEDVADESTDGHWALESAKSHGDTAQNVDDIARRIARWSEDAPTPLTEGQVRHRLEGGGYVAGLPALSSDFFFQYDWDDLGFPWPD